MGFREILIQHRLGGVQESVFNKDVDNSDMVLTHTLFSEHLTNQIRVYFCLMIIRVTLIILSLSKFVVTLAL